MDIRWELFGSVNFDVAAPVEPPPPPSGTPDVPLSNVSFAPDPKGYGVGVTFTLEPAPGNYPVKARLYAGPADATPPDAGAVVASAWPFSEIDLTAPAGAVVTGTLELPPGLSPGPGRAFLLGGYLTA